MLTKIDPQSVLQRAFPGIPDSEASKLIAASKLIHFMPGKIICREKAIETTFYILLKGEVRVTKKIFDLHHSTIQVESEPGAGSKFTISLQ